MICYTFQLVIEGKDNPLSHESILFDFIVSRFFLV